MSILPVTFFGSSNDFDGPSFSFDNKYLFFFFFFFVSLARLSEGCIWYPCLQHLILIAKDDLLVRLSGREFSDWLDTITFGLTLSYSEKSFDRPCCFSAFPSVYVCPVLIINSFIVHCSSFVVQLYLSVLVLMFLNFWLGIIYTLL